MRRRSARARGAGTCQPVFYDAEDDEADETTWTHDERHAFHEEVIWGKGVSFDQWTVPCELSSVSQDNANAERREHHEIQGNLAILQVRLPVNQLGKS